MNRTRLCMLALCVASAFAGAIAGVSFAAFHSVDLYAIYDRLDTTIANLVKLGGMLVPVVTFGLTFWRTGLPSLLRDVIHASGSARAAEEMPVTAGGLALSDALRKQP